MRLEELAFFIILILTVLFFALMSKSLSDLTLRVITYIPLWVFGGIVLSVIIRAVIGEQPLLQNSRESMFAASNGLMSGMIFKATEKIS